MNKVVMVAGVVIVGLPLVGVSSAAFADGGVVSGTVSTSASTQSATAPTGTDSPQSTQTSTPATPVTASPVATSQATAPIPTDAYPASVPAFAPRTVSADWFKAGGTVADPWPQSSAVITCGGVVQDDVYTITSQQMLNDYDALLDGGVLAGPAGDAEFAPHDYTVTQLPACDIPVAVAAPSVTSVCEPGDTVYYNKVVLPVISHITWSTDGYLGGTAYIATPDAGYTIGSVAKPGYIVDNQAIFTISHMTDPSKSCPTPPVVTPPTTPPIKPAPPVTRPAPAGPTTPTPTVTGVKSSAPTLGVKSVPVTFSRLSNAQVTSPTTSNGLAYTGSSDTHGGLIIAGLGLLTGLVLVVVSRVRRKKLSE